MKIEIDRFDLKDINIDPNTLFTFPEGIPGFESCKRFKLFHLEDKPNVQWLQSIDDTSVLFPITTPESLDFSYQIELSDADCSLLDLKDPETTAVAIIVYRNNDPKGNIVANTRSPLILNLESRKGMQKVLQDVQQTLLYRGS